MAGKYTVWKTPVATYGTWGLPQGGITRHLTPQVYNRGHDRLGPNQL